jgi:hypothetical protein
MANVKENYRQELINKIKNNLKDSEPNVLKKFVETLETLSIDELEMLADEAELS